MGSALHVDCVSNRGSDGILLDVRNSVTSVWMLFYQNPQPCSLDMHCPLHSPYATLCLHLWQEKGGEELV